MAKSKSQIAGEESAVEEAPAVESVAEAVEPATAPEAPAVEDEKPAEKPEKKVAAAPSALKDEPSSGKTVRIRNRTYAGMKVSAGKTVAEFDSQGIAEVSEATAELFLRDPAYKIAE